jgi:hypothetical protein
MDEETALSNFQELKKTSQSAKLLACLGFAHEIDMERAKSPIGRIRGESNKKALFEGVKFSLEPLLDHSLKSSVSCDYSSMYYLNFTLTFVHQITQLLVENGAINAEGNDEKDPVDDIDNNTITHIISKDTTFAGYHKALENKIAVVTVRKLHLSKYLTNIVF